jgi:thioester reductase-like protein
MNVSLLEQTKCAHFLYTKEVEGLVTPLLERKSDLTLHLVEALEDMIKPETPHFPWEKDYDSVKWDPILILHSSGSTGAPKPIAHNHATYAVADHDRILPKVPGRINQNWALWDFPQQETFFSPFPPFHLGGFSSHIVLPIWYQNATLVLSPPSRPTTGHLVSEIMDQFKLKAIFCPPIVAEQLVQEPDGLEKCKNLKFLLYAGGPLSQSTGDTLSKITDVCQFYGSTETGPVQTLVPRREDWASLEWNPIQEVVMEPYEDEIYEMTMPRNPNLEKVRSLTANFPDEEVWHTKDLFKRDPNNPALWKFHGRVDDIVVLSNGEKFNPVPSEVLISGHPLVNAAMIIGQGRPQPCLILEPRDPQQTLEDTIGAVWPSIENANSQAPGQGRVTRDMIILASPSRPFNRSPKGTVIRSSTTRLYQGEIDALYNRDISRNLEHISLTSTTDSNAVTKFVSDVVSSAFPNHVAQPTDDLFGMGLDSLQTMEIVKLLKAGIRANNKTADVSWVSMKYIYQHPTIAELAHAITVSSSGAINGISEGHVNGSALEHRAQKMNKLVEKYTTDLPPPPPRSERSSYSGFHVILTGSTGSLGTQLLVKLLSDPNVAKVTCLDRSVDASDRIKKSLSTWPKPPNIDPERVSFHQADYKKADFGLPSAVLSALRETANVIIHNAWKVDFNHSLETFEETHIRGMRNFIDLSISSARRPRIVFVSSISSVGDWCAVDPAVETIPESLPPTLAAALGTGYAESKAVSEHILAAAAERSGVDVVILRVGQIAGPVMPGIGGKWTKTEWFPIMLRTSKAMGKIPDGHALGEIDWIPVDLLSSIIWELSSAAGGLNSAGLLQIFNLVNPARRPWAEMLPAITAGLREGGSSEEVPMAEWISEVEHTDLNDMDDVLLKPAVKILDFFKGVEERQGVTATNGVAFSTAQAEKSSKVLHDLSSVQDAWLHKWIKDWGL